MITRLHGYTFRVVTIIFGPRIIQYLILLIHSANYARAEEASNQEEASSRENTNREEASIR